jgi:hypothetical protein
MNNRSEYVANLALKERNTFADMIHNDEITRKRQEAYEATARNVSVSSMSVARAVFRSGARLALSLWVRLRGSYSSVPARSSIRASVTR